MPKFDSPIKVSSIRNLGNNALLHLGADNRVGIGTENPESKLHVNGAITATGLIVPASSLAGQGDAAEVLGFTPNMDSWYVDEEGRPVVNGYVQTTGTSLATQSTDAQLGLYSAEFDNDDIIWSREVAFDSPLYANIFIQGTMSYKFDSHTAGTPGLAITLTHREKTNSDHTVDADGVIVWSTQSTNTFIVPISTESYSETGLGKFTTAPWRAHTPGNREITKIKVEIISSTTPVYPVGTSVHNDGGSGDASQLGGGTNYNWNLDGFSFQFMHPDLRVDQLGRITGALIAEATIEDLHIKDMISSTSSLIYSDSGELTQGLVANSSYANGWSIDKTGGIKATDIEIYGPDGTIFLDARGGPGGDNPFHQWSDLSLRTFDQTTYDYIYGLSFEESNRSNVEMSVGYLANTGTDSIIVQSAESLYIANTSVPTSGSTDQLSNGSITFNGVTSNAPPGSIYLGPAGSVPGLVKNLQDAYILFLSNTAKWATETSAAAEYHANTLLGDFGLYVIAKPTVGGWVYHPHANLTWYSIDDVQNGDALHQKDFIIIGKAGTNESGQFVPSLTSINSPRSLDSIVLNERLSTAPPIGITAGGILFADIHINQYNHTANNGEIQLTNRRNTPNTRFTFIHPGTSDPNDSTVHTVNGAYGILTSHEQFPGSRYITFIGTDKTRFSVVEGHSPDFVAAYPIGSRWFYDVDEGNSLPFTPSDKDCIVARVDSNGVSFASGDGSTGITNLYRYAEREAVTSEGASISDMIIDPPTGMTVGGVVFAEMTINKEYNSATQVFTANDGFVSFVNPDNAVPKNQFFVAHPENRYYFWQTSNVARGVATSLRPDADVTGTRHIAFVGHDSSRFVSLPAYENVSNDFIAVSKYDSQGNPHPDGKWYYDPGTGISDTYTFTVDANDFIVATLSSFNPETQGIDQLTRWAEREGVVYINGEPKTVDSIRNELSGDIGTAQTRADDAFDLAGEALANAQSASSNAFAALGLLDGSITLYLKEEGDVEPSTDGVFANNNHDDVPPLAFGYGDLWINVSTYNRALDGTWYANAIFRFQNATGGFTDVTGDNGLSWRHDPTNPQGLAYLETLRNREITDRHTNFYYTTSFGGGTHGPNVALITATGPDIGTGRQLLNFNPDGDFWYAQDPGDLNHPYIYRTNTSFSESTPLQWGYPLGIGTTGEWAQTVYGSAASFDPVNDPTGWYDTRDTAFTNPEDAFARELAQNALSAAANSQYSADREIIAFFEAHDVADVPDPTGNGDIWIHTDTAIHTDGTKNAYAIYISNTLSGGIDSGITDPLTGYQMFWHPAPNNAIGLMYLESYAAGVSGEFQRGTNLMPRGYSLFDSPLTDYKIFTTDPGDGMTERLPIDLLFNTGNVAIDRTGGANAYIGSSSLRVDTVSLQSVFFGRSRTDSESEQAKNKKYRFDIPKAKKFIFSYYIKSDAAIDVIPTFYFSNTTNDYAGLQTGSSQTLSTSGWQRLQQVIDLTSGAVATAGYGGPKTEVTSISVQWTYSGAANTFIDAIQLEEVPNTVFTASQFKEPSDASSIVFSREITDGKIVTHYSNHFISDSTYYGPQPNTTPKGYPNPEPDGDFWVDTGNNNIVFRYNQNNSINWAQTVYWTSVDPFDVAFDESGWYTTEDLRTSNALNTSYDALANAATAQAAADREILAYFETEAPTASGFGDIWIDIDKYATLNTSAIHTANTQSSGKVADAGGTLFWHSAPNNAVGQVYLNAYLAQKKANRSESLILSVSESGDLPFPVYPDTKGIFVGATGNLVFYKNSRTEYLEDQPAGDDKNTVFVSNRGGIDLVGPRGNIYYPNSGDFGIKDEGYVRIPATMNTVTNSTFSSIYLMYTNMNAVARFELTGSPFGTHNHIIPVRWNRTTWQTFDLAGTTIIDFTPDAANGDFLVAKLNREYAYPEGLESIDRWVFKTLPTQTQAFGDGKIVTHYSPHFGGGTHGPRANLTPTGLHNPDPYGDFWVNTSANNVIFRYHTNAINNWAQTAFDIPLTPETNGDQAGWYSLEDPRTANNEYYLANGQIWLTNLEGNVFTINAESSNAHLFLNFAFANISFVNGVAYNANQAAYIAQAAADREILAFFDVYANVPEATGNGDVWIQTDTLIKSDGTLNAAAIHVANTFDSVYGIPDAGDAGGFHYWYSSPNNAIGLMYAKSYAAGIGGSFQRGTNIMPRGYSLFDAPLTDYYPASTDDIATSTGGPAESIVSSRTNGEPYPFYYYTQLPASALSRGSKIDQHVANVAIDKTGGSNSYVGDSSLRIETVPSTEGTPYFAGDGSTPEGVTFSFNLPKTAPIGSQAFASGNNFISVPKGKRWIFSYYAKSNTNVETSVGSYFSFANDTSSWAGSFRSTQTNIDISDTWQRHSTIIDLTTSDLSEGAFTAEYFSQSSSQITPKNQVTKIIPTITVNASSTQGVSYYIDAIQFEEVEPEVATPSQFNAPSENAGLVFGRRLVDGKIVTHYSNHFVSDSTYYGPKPHITPLGYPNPEPDGDFWVDTGNNQIMFRYNQNTSVNFAQTAYWSPVDPFDVNNDLSGWYALEDPRTGNSEVWLASTEANLYQFNANNIDYIGFASRAAELAQLAADREINGFFEPSTGTVPKPTGNGDVWIHTDTAIFNDPVPSVGSRSNTGAIFVANTLADGDYYDGLSGFYWWQSPNNAVGRAYLESYASGNRYSDGRMVVHYANAFSDGATPTPPDYYGPNPNTTPQGVDNPYPGGDLWIDTANNRIQFIYLQNNSINYGQTVFWDISSQYEFVPASSQSGWYSIEDPRTENYNANAVFWTENALANALSANTNAYIARISADHEIVAFFKAHNDTPAATGQGDVWIHSDNAIYINPNPTIGAVQNTGAVYIANTYDSGLEARADGGQFDPQLWWNQSPNNALGLMYLESYVAGRRYSDGRMVTHYSNAFIVGSTYYGPNPNTTPLGVDNPYPDGDLWIDTSNNWIQFRYLQNNTINFAQTASWAYDFNFDPSSSESGWYSLEDPRLANSQYWLGEVDSAINDPVTGLSSTYNAAQQALRDAASAASAADAEIQIFFQPSTNADMVAVGNYTGINAGPATGNGDIWIHIDQVYDADGNQNTGAIFFANLSPFFKGETGLSYNWQQSPDNAIGRGFLDQFTAVGRKNWMPSGYSTWDADTVGDDFVFSPNYNINLVSEQNAETPYPITTRNDWFGTGIVNTTFGKVSDGSLQMTVDPTVDGTGSFIFNFANVSAEWNRQVLNKPKGATLKIPKGKRWIFSYYSYTNSTLATASSPSWNPTVSLNIVAYDSANTTANTGQIRLNTAYPENGKWTRHSAVIDLSNTAATLDNSPVTGYPLTDGVSSVIAMMSDGLGLSAPFTNTASKDVDSLHLRWSISGYGNTVWFDGFQLEEAPGAQILPGPFSDPDRAIDSNFARSIADGKVVSHYVGGVGGGSGRVPLPTGGSTDYYYGPRPHRTPSGYINPSPHGDLWYDTANGNIGYRYNANDTYSFSTRAVDDEIAQRAYWDTIANKQDQVGWYVIQDENIARAQADLISAGARITDAENELSNITAITDGEIKLFFNVEDASAGFANDLPTVIISPSPKYGDIWINTSGYNENSDGTLSTNAIFRWQNTTTGYLPAADLRWHHAPDNAFGQLYLPTFRAQKSTDRKSLIYVEAGSGDPYVGPDTTNEPGSSIPNNDPDGDIWYDTANNNAEYIYHYTGTLPRHRTIYYTAYNYASSASGWYSVENLLIGSQQRALELAAATGTDRIVELFANTIAPSASGNGDVWVQTTSILNGDGTPNYNAIYVANTSSSGGIIENEASSPAHYWHSTPTSALGRSLVDRLVNETGKNYIPRGYSTFDSDENDYLFKTGSVFDAISGPSSNKPYRIVYNLTQDDVPAKIIESGPGANTYIGTKSLEFIIKNVDTGGSEVETNITFGAGSFGADDRKALPFVIPAGRKWVYSWWQNSSNPTRCTSPYLLRIYVSNTQYTYAPFLDIREANDPTTPPPGFVTQSTTSAYEWKRYYVYLDFTGSHNVMREAQPFDAANPLTYAHSNYADDDITSVMGSTNVANPALNFPVNQITHLNFIHSFRAQEVASGGSPETIHYDAIMLEDVTGSDRRTPGPFQEPSGSDDVDYNRALSDGKTVQFVSPAYDNGSFKNSFGPDPSLTDNGLSNPEPYGDKLITTTPPYKTYMYFSNATNKTSQTMHHSLSSNSANFKVENTRWPFGASNNISGWYEYLDVGSSLLQEGYEVQLGRVALGLSTWTLGDPQDILGRGIVADPEDQDPTNQAPLLNIGNPSQFGGVKEILLNPVPPPDTNLHAHWTLNSYDVDDDGNYLVRDVSGRNNHAAIGGTVLPPQFYDHDPAQDVINVSGNHSLFLDSIWGAAANKQWLVLGRNAEAARTYKGNQYPLKITDTTGASGGYNKYTLVFWWKPETIKLTDNKFLVGQDAGGTTNGNWAINIGALNANNDYMGSYWAIYNSVGDTDNVTLNNDATGWLGPTDGGEYNAFRKSVWHMVAIQTNHVDSKQTLSIYREGEGLLYHNTRTLQLGTTAATADRGLILNGDPSASATSYTASRNNANGYYDEVRLYNSILTPRNIRYLYENPTGRARQLQPRPGMAVKPNYENFYSGYPNITLSAESGSLNSRRINAFAYFHGFDVDGNPADLDPYVSHDGVVKYLKKGFIHTHFGDATRRQQYEGNTFYIIYNDPPLVSGYSYYSACQPVGNDSVRFPNNPDKHTWRRLDATDWVYFTPDDETQLIVGEGRFANSIESGGHTGGGMDLKNLRVYQFSRNAESIRESYNFNIRREDFFESEGMGNHFFANALFWTGDQGRGLLNGTYIETLSVNNSAIKDLAVEKLQAGTIGVSLKVGGDLKIELDGVNNRIIVRE